MPVLMGSILWITPYEDGMRPPALCAVYFVMRVKEARGMEEKLMIDFSDAFERQAPPADTALEREQERLTREVASLERRRQRFLRRLLWLFFGSPVIMGAALHFEFTEAAGWYGVVVVVALVMLDNLVEKYAKQLNATRAALDNLVSLDADSKPDECIQLDVWREQDETVAAYLAALAGLGRKPVMGEYRAAEAWVGNQKAEKRERARQACARFAS